MMQFLLITSMLTMPAVMASACVVTLWLGMKMIGTSMRSVASILIAAPSWV